MSTKRKFMRTAGLLIVAALLFAALPAGEARAQTIPTINHGTFGGAPYALDDAAAVTAFKNEALEIAAGSYISDTEYHTLEGTIISFDGGLTYVTDRGGCIYVQTVINGLQAGDIVEIDNNSFEDMNDGAGFYSFWDQDPYWIKIGDYTHATGDTILNWLIYSEKINDTEYRLVVSSGVYELAEYTDDLTSYIGYMLRLTRDIKVYRGEDLVNPTTSSRGYIASTSEDTSSWSTPIANDSLNTGGLLYTGVQESYVDDNWAGSSNGDIVGGSYVYGQDAFATIQQAIAGTASGGTVNVAAGTYIETGQIVIDKDLSIVGEDKTTTIIKPDQDTGSSGDSRGWFLVQDGFTFNLSNVTLDGDGFKVHQAIRSLGAGTINNNIIKNIKYSQYVGLGMVVMGDYNMTFSNNTFSNIERVGMMAYGTGVTSAEISGNTYTGKGEGDWLDYGVEVGGGAKATITGNTITDCVGVAASDGSESGAILVTDYYGPGTVATVNNNNLSNNTIGLAVGYDDTDASVATASGNTFSGNEFSIYAENSTNINLTDALANNTFDKAVWIDGGFIVYSSIQDAIDDASDSDTINVAAGTYEELVTLDKMNLVLKSESQHSAVIKPLTEREEGPYGAVLITADGVTLDGFEINGNTVCKNGINAYGVSNVTIKNNIVHGADSGWDGIGILVWDWDKTKTVDNALIEGNQVYDTGRMGIFVMDYGDAGYDITEGHTIIDNIVYNTWKVGWGDKGGGIQINAGKNCSIANNEIYDTQNENYGIYMFGSGDGNQITNNIVRNNPMGLGLWVSGLPGGDTIHWEDDSPASPEIHSNQFVDNADFDVISYDDQVLDATPNWWGSIAGPAEGQIEGNVTYSPWCGDAECSFFVTGVTPVEEDPVASGNNLATALINAQPGDTIYVPSGTYTVDNGFVLDKEGVTIILADGAVIQNNSSCFIVTEDHIRILGEFPGEEFCIPTDDSAGIEVDPNVSDLVIKNLDFVGTQTSGPAIHFAGDIHGVQIVNNKFHDFTITAINFVGVEDVEHVIQGNMFMNVGDPAIFYNGSTSLDAAYNSWGKNEAPTIPNVTTSPFTHVNIWAESSGAFSGDQVAKGGEVTYTIFANMTNIAGAEFTLTYPTDLLSLNENGTTEGDGLFEGIYTSETTQSPLLTLIDGGITFRGTAVGGPLTTNDPVALFTATFTAVETIPDPNEGLMGLVEIVQGFSMSSDGENYTNHVYPAGLLDGDVKVVEPPKITSDTVAGPYLMNETKEFQVSVDNTDPNNAGSFVHVLFEIEVTADDGDIVLFQYNDGSTWMDMPLDCTTTAGTCFSHFGPSEGFSMPAGYTADTTFRVQFANGGNYPVTLTLIDKDADDIVITQYDATAEVINAWSLAGKVTMQGRTYRGDVPMTLTGPADFAFGPFLEESLDQMGLNLFFTNVAEGEYTINTNQDRYLNVQNLVRTINDDMNFDLYLYGGNAQWSDNVINISDASKVGTYYGIGDITFDADVNFDDKVNIQDLALVGGNFNLTSNVYESLMTLNTDSTTPTLDDVDPAEGNVDLGATETFVWTVDASDEGDNLFELEVDHSMEGTIPEFSVYANAINPYGTAADKAQFEAAGVSVSYDAAAQKWVIDFGDAMTNQVESHNGITFYVVLKDRSGNQWGTMSGPTPENTFAYTISRSE